MLRVAALQFTSAADVGQNLATCLELIGQAARDQGAQLLVLPEFSNHAPVLSDTALARAVAASWDGPFLVPLREACVQRDLHLVVGVSFMSDMSQITSSALMIGPDGGLLACADRQVLSAELLGCHVEGLRVPTVVDTRLGRLGMCVGRDAASMESVRLLAVAGAQVVCACLGPDSARDLSIHMAARAAENRLFIVASAPAPSLAFEPSLDCSQIVAPDGTVKAVATQSAECVVSAEIEPQEAAEKCRADGTDVLAMRRPEHYRALLSRAPLELQDAAFEPVEVALLSSVDAGSVEGAIESAACFVRDLAEQGAALVVLPELFCFERGVVEDVSAAARWFVPAVRRLAEACAGNPTHVVTSLVEQVGDTYRHAGVVIGHAGLVARSAQLHVPRRHAWATPGERLQIVPLPWGRLGLLIGEEAIVPEAARALALLGADLLAIAGSAGEAWEAAVGFTAMAIENGVAVAAAMRETEAGGSVIIDLLHHDRPLRAAKHQALLRAAIARPTERSAIRLRSQRMGRELARARTRETSPAPASRS